MIYKAREEAEGVLVVRKEERGRAFQTQRSVVEGEEQRELMWTKGRAKKKNVHDRERENETEGKRKDREQGTGGERWSVPSDRTNLSIRQKRGEYGTLHPKFDRTSHPPADHRSVVMLPIHSVHFTVTVPTLWPHMFFTGPTGFVLSSGPLQRKQTDFTPWFQ